MTILITADLHLDMWARAGRDPFAGILPVLRDLDALIVAGDLANDPQRNWPRALARIARLVSPARIWVIPGNHDYYGATLDDSLLSRIATETGVSFAQKQVLTFGTCRILCCTLWTDFALLGDPGSAMDRAAMAMPDYARIRRAEGGLICPEDTAAIHRDHLDWLSQEIAKPWQGQTIVVTHHAPSAAVFFSETEGRFELETRFKKHLRKLRCRRIPPNLLAPPDEVDAPDESPDMDLADFIGISAHDATRINRRVKRLLELRKAASGLEHLKRDDRERLEVLKDGARLIRIRNEHHADEIAAELHGGMLWMAPATEVIWHAMRRSWREGAPGLRIPPLLLDGPPGIGKSYLARVLAKLLATSTAVIEATGENASFGIVGSQRGWARPAQGA